MFDFDRKLNSQKIVSKRGCLDYQPNPITSYLVVWTSWSLSPMSSWTDVFDDRNLIGWKAGGGAQSDPLLFSPPYAWPAAPALCTSLLLSLLCALFDWSIGCLTTSPTTISPSIYSSLCWSICFSLCCPVCASMYRSIHRLNSLSLFVSWSFFVYRSLCWANLLKPYSSSLSLSLSLAFSCWMFWSLHLSMYLATGDWLIKDK